MQRNLELTQNLKNRFASYSYTAPLVLMVALTCVTTVQGSAVVKEHLLPVGSYLPFYAPKASAGKPKIDEIRKAIAVKSFWLDNHPVTNGEFLNFVKKSPEWRRSSIASIFADHSYLKHWRSDLKLRTSTDQNRPVVHVSWFAATAYCQAQGKELPTNDQWEYAAEDAGRNVEQIKSQILSWYSVPNPKVLNMVKSQPANGYGIYDLHGLVWEWTQDFNSAMVVSELRSDGTKDDNLFCGAGSLGALDASDYAKFTRYSLRSSLLADYTTANLGFRCAREEIK